MNRVQFPENTIRLDVFVGSEQGSSTHRTRTRQHYMFSQMVHPPHYNPNQSNTASCRPAVSQPLHEDWYKASEVSLRRRGAVHVHEFSAQLSKYGEGEKENATHPVYIHPDHCSPYHILRCTHPPPAPLRLEHLDRDATRVLRHTIAARRRAAAVLYLC